MMRSLATIVLFCLCTEISAQVGRYSVLDMTLSEVRFLAEREGIELSPEHELENNKVVVMYKKRKAQWEKVDLKSTVSLYFDISKNSVCYEIIDLIGISENWVADTVINRLRIAGYDEYRANLFHCEALNCAVKLEYIRPIDAKTRKPLPINMLRVVYWTLVKK